MSKHLFGYNFESSGPDIPLYIQELLDRLHTEAERSQQPSRMNASQFKRLAQAEVGSQEHSIYCVYSAWLYACYQQQEPWQEIAALLAQAATLLESLPED